MLQDSSRGRFFKNLVSFWSRFWKKIKDFQTRFQYNFHANVAFDAYFFFSIEAASFQLTTPIFSFLARWRLFARSALVYIRRPAKRWMGVCKPRSRSSQYQLSNPYLMVLGGPQRALKCLRKVPSRPHVIQFFDSSSPFRPLTKSSNFQLQI